jgi:hypothetical protein
MPLLPLDKYSQTKHIRHCPCMWEDSNALSMIAVAVWMPVWVGGFSAMVLRRWCLNVSGRVNEKKTF